MRNIEYKEIDDETEEKIIAKWGNWVRDWGEIHRGEGCYSLAAICNSEPVGFISAYPLYYPAPLEKYCDAYIGYVGVDKEHRRQGIATKLIDMTEQWAKEYGYRQIRGWDEDEKIEALSMWYKRGYAMCPAIMRGVCPDEKARDKIFYGFYVAKVLNPN